MTTKLKVDILSEDFEMPTTTIELCDLIEDSIDIYYSMPMNRSITVKWRTAVNLLIDELHERRGSIKLYNHIH